MNNNKIFIYGIEILFALGISLGSQSLNFENLHKWVVIIARYIAYIVIIKGTHEACVLGYSVFHTRDKLDVKVIWKRCKTYAMVLAAAVACVAYHKQRVLGEDFLLLFIAHLVTKYPEMEQISCVINYGMGMAYSFYEGYLAQIIPSDGARFVGFEENINTYEAKQGVVFPVKRLFIVITKSLYCPPDLKHFNKSNRDLPYLEACKSLEDVEKDVAGVKNRTYRNSAYVIYRQGRRPVYLSVECATPLHTLYRVLQKKTIYEELAHVEPAELVNDFCSTLRSIVQKNPESRDKCELVFYDDLDPTQNLADILLDKIRELEPDFENIINRRE
ncbi:stimulator of interferon genes protein-like isoform X2 [Pararge aegeria]|uniref:Jg27030 protein n=1 Tax=Pararge aegeria aegeria TaxID=348720 RepID=A0A8S4SQ21_9NEOP|nr:stimulator of interferon genes protein-like isoform X2 [Pararge aegeria]CAH2269083.1 jg27030 [Pararge aegeria aegeria]